MRIKSLATKIVYDLEFSKSGENTSTCPDCIDDRKNKKAKPFSFNVSKGRGYCNHCNAAFVEETYGKEFTKPVFDETFKSLKPAWVDNFLAKRSISESTLTKMKVSEKNGMIAYPFFRKGELINVKYRGANKEFRLESGAELCWYNYDAILNFKEIVIVEGETDCLSFIESGIENCISVPNGANVGKMEYFDNSISDLDKIERFYICTDADTKGMEIRDELIRRLGEDKCFTCNLRQYKDANEYLIGQGRESLLEVIKTAKNVKINGVIEFNDFKNEFRDLHKNGLQPGKTIGAFLDKLITWETGRLAIFSGVPSCGKSELVDFINIKLSMRHGWKVAYYSPESHPSHCHSARLSEKMAGCKFEKITDDSLDLCERFIQDNFFWIDTDENSVLDDILLKFKQLIKTKGVKILVIDPWNCIENDGGYLDQGRLLQKIVKFARRNNVLIILVAHPRKLATNKDTRKFEMPTMYDIAGSSDFWNMCDYGVLIQREQEDNTLKFLNNGKIQIAKVKTKNLGEQGVANFKYGYYSGRYFDETESFDDSNWLNPTEIILTMPIPMNNNIFNDIEVPF
jgi:twinkle protein